MQNTIQNQQQALFTTAQTLKTNVASTARRVPTGNTPAAMAAVPNANRFGKDQAVVHMSAGSSLSGHHELQTKTGSVGFKQSMSTSSNSLLKNHMKQMPAGQPNRYMELRSGNVKMSMGGWNSNNQSAMKNSIKVTEGSMMRSAANYARGSVVMSATSDAPGSDTTSFRITGELSYLDGNDTTDYFDKSF